MLPVLSVLLDVTVIQKRRKYPGRMYSILAGHAGGDFADGGGGSDSVQCYEA